VNAYENASLTFTKIHQTEKTNAEVQLGYYKVGVIR